MSVDSDTRAVATTVDHPEPAVVDSGRILSSLIKVEHVSPAAHDRIRAVRHIIAFLVWVGLPTIMGGVYFGMVASDMFVSEAKITVRNVQNSSGILDNFISKSLGGGSNEDTALVVEYMKSREILHELEDLIDIRAMYARPDVDILSQMEKDGSFENFYRYFNNVVQVEQDNNTGVTTLQVRAFAPQDAQSIAEVMISLTDLLMDKITERGRNDALSYARAELARLKQGLRDLNQKIMQFRIEGNDINPLLSARAVHRIVGQLEGDLVMARTQLAETEAFMLPESTLVTAMRNRIRALEDQLVKEKKRLAGKDTGTFSETVSAYEGLMLEQKLMEKTFAAALAGYEAAKAETQQRQAYLVAYVPPNLPDQATYPDRLISALTVFFGAVLFYGIGTLMLASIKEQTRL